MISHSRIVRLEDYEKYVGPETVERIQKKATPLRDIHIANINSTFYGGGVAELLTNCLQDLALAFEPGEKGVLTRPPANPRPASCPRLLSRELFSWA
jgi:hypothetical protein